MTPAPAITSRDGGSRHRPFALTVLLALIAYTTYFASKAVFVVCFTPLLIVLIPFPNAKYRLLQLVTGGYLTFFTRRWLPLLGVYRIVEISGLEQALAQRPVVFTANHRSFMDALLLLSLVPRMGVLIKVRDARKLTQSLLVRHFDLVSVDARRLDRVAEALAVSRQLLMANKSLLVFPEGTRARSGRLQNFNLLAFELAKATGRPVVPVIIHSTQPLMAKVPGSIFPRGRNEYRIRFLDPERPRADDTAASLCDRVHRRMAQELKTLDAGTIWEVRRIASGAPVREQFVTKTQ